MTTVIQNLRQVLLGSIFLSLGIITYIAFRPSGQATWIPEMISLDWSKFQIIVKIGNSIPSFLHILSFSLLTAGIMAQNKKNYMIICFTWFFINLLFEFLQANTVFTLLNSVSDNHDKLNPLLQWLKNFSMYGVFDPKDIIALIIGAIIAYIVLIKSNKGG